MSSNRHKQHHTQYYDFSHYYYFTFHFNYHFLIHDLFIYILSALVFTCSLSLVCLARRSVGLCREVGRYAVIKHLTQHVGPAEGTADSALRHRRRALLAQLMLRHHADNPKIAATHYCSRIFGSLSGTLQVDRHILETFLKSR